VQPREGQGRGTSATFRMRSMGDGARRQGDQAPVPGWPRLRLGRRWGRRADPLRQGRTGGSSAGSMVRPPRTYPMREARTPAAMQAPGSIFDWNRESPEGGAPLGFGLTRRIAIVDETLRDGMQNATGVAGPIGAKVDLLHAMVRVGVDVVSVGLPAAGARYAADTEVLCREIREARLPLIATAAA